MGRSRAKRGLSKNPPAAQPAPVQTLVGIAPSSAALPSIPDLTRLDLAFGNIGHMPRYDTIPDQFKRSGNPYADFVSSWFFRGLKPADLERLVPRPGVDRNKAMVAIRAILGSFEPKHEHKNAGCAFLLHSWFDLSGAQS